MLVVLGLVVVLVAGVAGWSALTAARSLQRAQAQLQGLQDGELTPDVVATRLRSARGEVAAAQDALDGFSVRAMSAVPVLGRSWDAEVLVAEVADAVLDAAVLAVDAAPDLTDQGQVDLVVLQDLRDGLSAPSERARRALDELAGSSTTLTPSAVGEGVDDALQVFTPVVAGLASAVSGLEAVHGILGGDRPRSILVALGNNAELRGSGGYVASVATGRTEAGALQLGPLQDVVEFADPAEQARSVPAPEEYVDDYGPLSGNTTLFRSWNMSPDVPASAEVGARIAGELLGQAPDVMVLLDVPAMRALAELGGGDVPLGDGRAVSPQDLQQALLVDSYDEAGEDFQAQAARRRELQEAASLVVARLLGSDVPALDVVRTLGRLTQERHLTLWSAVPAEQEVLEELGLAGSVGAPAGEDLLHVAVNNIGSNKLDVYVERSVELEAVVGLDKAEVTQRVTFTNRAPEDLVAYVEGFEKPGTVVSRVELSLPTTARVTSTSVDGAPLAGSLRQGVDRRRLATRLELPRGASSVLEVRYELPLEGAHYRLTALPQPLASDAELRLTVRPAAGVELVDSQGQPLPDDELSQVGPFTATQQVRLAPPVREPGLGERLRAFWDEPVRIG